MGTSVGEIQLDLVTNQSQFNSQMKGIQATAKKAGIAVAAAFGVKKIVDFGKEALKLGSDLSEVQNVVDVTFPHMTKKIDEFAKTAASNFGLSETMAKKYSGLYGAMAKAFGFSEKAAYDMSTQLTSLAGDVASFYNISQDEAYTKLKSVFSGETETLKDLGIVMTQNALDSYALANGYGKVTSKMSEMEKVALRYKFVQSQLSAASGDFIRTQNSWANQTRILQLQYDSLKASLGQGLINVLTPLLQLVNLLISKLTLLAQKFASLTGSVFGKQDTAGNDVFSEVGSSADNASGKITNIGKSAKKTAKELQKSVMSFDKINKLSSKEDSDTAAGDTGIGSSNASEGNNIANASKKTSSLLDGLKRKFSALRKEFSKGFVIGAGNIDEKVKSIKKHLSSIGSSVKEIFSDRDVKDAFVRFAKLISKNTGVVVGAITSMLATVADNLVGGIDIFLANNKDSVKRWIINMFDISGEISTITANFTKALSNVFEVFRSYDAKKITADIIDLFWTGFSGATELFLKIGRDILNLITKPIIDNQNKIKEALSGVLKSARIIMDSLVIVFKTAWTEINKLYDSKIKTFFDKITEIVSDVTGIIVDKLNKYVVPALKKVADIFAQVATSKIVPVIMKIAGAVSSLVELIIVVVSKLWAFLKPVVTWIVDKIGKVLSPIIIVFGKVFSKVFGTIADAVGFVADRIKNVFQIIIGLFSGNKDKVKGEAAAFGKSIVSGIKGGFVGIASFFKNIFVDSWSKIKMCFSIEGAKQFFTKVCQGIKSPFGNIAKWFKENFRDAWKGVLDVFSNKGKIFDGIKAGISDVFKTVVNKLIAGINTVISIPFKAINGMLNKVRNVGIGNIKPFQSLWPKNPINAPRIPKLANGGYVKANTPQLAMIGDNRRYGEVVAPENKMLEMAKQAAVMAQGGVTEELILLLKEIIKILQNMDLDIYMDGEKLTTKIINRINKRSKSVGKPVIEVR